MNFVTRSVFPLSLLASTALGTSLAADITPAEAWQDLQAYMESNGYAVTGTETVQGSVLSVTDVLMVAETTEGDGEVRIELGTITFTQSDAAVVVTFPDTMPIRFDVETEPGTQAIGTVAYTHTGLDTRVSGSATSPEWTYNADMLTLELTELEVDGDGLTPDAARFEMTFSGVSGTMSSEISSVRASDQSFASDTVAYSIFFSDPEDTSAVFDLSGGMTGLRAVASSELPLTEGAAEMRGPFAMGTFSDVDLSHNGGTLRVDASDGRGATRYDAASQSGTLALDLTDEALGYAVSSQGVRLQLVTPDIPIPVDLTMAQGGFELSGPSRPTETAQPFQIGIDMQGFEMTELLWSMFDPGQVLSRAPASLQFALSGTLRQLIDFTDQDDIDAFDDGELPVEVETVQIDALSLDAAGLGLTGTGGFVFDNADLTTFPGFPAPSGSVTLTLSGANALINNLISMGLLPAEQAMGARMMMGMFARPVGDDVLSSTLEITDEGHILANGQRLQ